MKKNVIILPHSCILTFLAFTNFNYIEQLYKLISNININRIFSSYQPCQLVKNY